MFSTETVYHRVRVWSNNCPPYYYERFTDLLRSRHNPIRLLRAYSDAKIRAERIRVENHLTRNGVRSMDQGAGDARSKIIIITTYNINGGGRRKNVRKGKKNRTKKCPLSAAKRRVSTVFFARSRETDTIRRTGPTTAIWTRATRRDHWPRDALVRHDGHTD